MGETTQKIAEELKKVKKNYCGSFCVKFFKAVGVLVGLVVIVACIGAFATAVYGVKYNLKYSSVLKGRLLAYVALATCAVACLSFSIFILVRLFKENKKPLFVTGVLLLVITIIQSTICGLSVYMTPKDNDTISESLAESFQLSNSGSNRDLQYWGTLSSDFKCCGIIGPDDYSDQELPHIFPPNIPAFCCPGYNASQSKIAQEVLKEICKVKGTYFTAGCEEKLKLYTGYTAGSILVTTILLVVLEFLSTLYIFIAYKVSQTRQPERPEQQKDVETVNEIPEAGTSND